MNRNIFLIVGAIGAVVGYLFRSIILSFIENNLPDILEKSYAPVIVSLISIGVAILIIIEKSLSRLELQEKIRTELNNLFTELKKNEEKAKTNTYFNSLQDNILGEAWKQIHDIGKITPSHSLKINNEFTRIQFIRHLFNNNVNKKIIAVTYDINGYFLNFWGGQNSDDFIEVNKKAAKEASIERFFIFNRSEFEDPNNSEKRDLYNEIYASLSGLGDKVKTHQIWAEELHNDNPRFPKRSFLVIDDFVTSEVKEGDTHDGYLAFGDQEKIHTLKNRYKKLLTLISANAGQ